jgi:PAP2 superfamily
VDWAKHKRLLGIAVLPVLLFHIFFVGLLWKIGNDPILSLGISGAFVIHCWRGRPRMEYFLTIALAVLLRIAYQLGIGVTSQYFGHTIVSWGSFLGIASLLVLGWRTLRAHGDLRQQPASDLLAGASFFFFWIVFDIGLALTTILLPHTYDQYLYAFDNSLGGQPSFLLARLISGRPTVSGITHLVYGAITLPIAMLYASQRCRGYANGYKIFPLLIAAATGGYLLYYALPATGPAFAFAGLFPFSIPPVHLDGDVAALSHRAARNALPSLHLGAALIVCWNSRAWPKAARAGLGLFALATVFATLALGEHYVVDLVVAFPVMLALHAAAMTAVPLRAPERRLPILAGLTATLAWLLLLRFGGRLYLNWPTTVPWVLAASTVAGTCFLESRLARRVRQIAGPVQNLASHSTPHSLAASPATFDQKAAVASLK